MDNNTSIIVNGRKETLKTNEVSFDDLVKEAFPDCGAGEDIYFTITYEGGGRKSPEGTLSKGSCVEIKDGMIFNVSRTDKS